MGITNANQTSAAASHKKFLALPLQRPRVRKHDTDFISALSSLQRVFNVSANNFRGQTLSVSSALMDVGHRDASAQIYCYNASRYILSALRAAAIL